MAVTPGLQTNRRRLARAACAIAAVCSLAAVFAEPTLAADARRKIIIDQDAFGPAGSDLQSILMLLQSPDVEVLGITVVSGDGWRDEEVDHTLRLLEVAQRTEVPVYAGAVFPLVNSAARTKAWEARYGRLVYKGAWSEKLANPNSIRRSPYHADPFLVPPSPAGTAAIKVQAENAASFLARTVRANPGEVTIWAGGPLTNLALAARIDPQFASLAKELVFVGGSFNPAAANNASSNEYINSPRRSFNMFFDPEAATLVLHEPWRKITEIPTDPTTKTFASAELYSRISEGDAPFTPYLAANRRNFPLWDELAAGVWLDPSIVTRHQTLLVDIDTSDGSGYGSTLSWPLGGGPALGEQPMDVVQEVDVPRLEAMTLQLLSHPKAAPSR
jgi:purine nucleosidase